MSAEEVDISDLNKIGAEVGLTTEILDLSKKVEVKEPVEKEIKPVELTEDEKLAISKGWTPRDQFKGDPSEFKGAKAYLKDGEVLDALSLTKKQVKELKKTVDALLEQQSKVVEVTKQERIAKLKKEQEEAASYGQVDKVKEITDTLITEAHPKPVGQSEREVLIQEENRKFVEKYAHIAFPTTAEDLLIRNELEKLDTTLANSNSNLTPKQHFTILENALEKMLKKRNEGNEEIKTTKSVVESGTASVGSKSKKVNFSDLSSAQKNMVRMLEKSPNWKGLDAYKEECDQLGVNIYE